MAFVGRVGSPMYLMNRVARALAAAGISTNQLSARTNTGLYHMRRHTTISVMVSVQKPGYILKNPKYGKNMFQVPRRQLWGMLNAVFNRPDNNRIKEVGAQRACAEWLLRCGAHVRWQGMPNFQDDYNKLPSGGFHKFKIEEINADDAAVMAIGFPHFDGVGTVKKIRFHHCAYLYDEAMFELVRLKDSLEHLEISSCGDISDKGLESLTQLTNLKRLVLFELTGVRNKKQALEKLQDALPNCDIDFKDVQT